MSGGFSNFLVRFSSTEFTLVPDQPQFRLRQHTCDEGVTGLDSFGQFRTGVDGGIYRAARAGLRFAQQQRKSQRN